MFCLDRGIVASGLGLCYMFYELSQGLLFMLLFLGMAWRVGGSSEMVIAGAVNERVGSGLPRKG